MGVLYYIIMQELLLLWTSLKLVSKEVTRLQHGLMRHRVCIEGTYLPLPNLSTIDFSLLTDEVW